MKNSYRLPKKLWAGFCNGKIDLDPFESTEGHYGVLYKTKREAEVYYEDVRLVEVREAK